MRIRSLILDLRNVENKEKIKDYVLNNSIKTVSPKYMPDVMYVYMTNDVYEELDKKDINITEQGKLVQM